MSIFGIVPPAAQGSLGNGFGRFEPKRAYNFRISFQVEASSAIKTLFNEPRVQDSLAHTIKSIQRPQLGNAEGKIQHGNESFRYAGRPTLANDTVTGIWYDIVPGSATTRISGLPPAGEDTGLLSASSIFWEWEQIIYDVRSGRLSMANEYKANMIVELMTPEAANIIERWVYYGLWPKQVDWSTDLLDMAGDDAPRTITVNFAVDKIFRVDPKGTADKGSAGAVDLTSSKAGGTVSESGGFDKGDE